jgi:hypothetical protein
MLGLSIGILPAAITQGEGLGIDQKSPISIRLTCKEDLCSPEATRIFVKILNVRFPFFAWIVIHKIGMLTESWRVIFFVASFSSP